MKFNKMGYLGVLGLLGFLGFVDPAFWYLFGLVVLFALGFLKKSE